MGPGPFTVFAPTNDAFAALPAGTVETLLNPENKAMLVKVLTAHVVAAKLSTAEIMARAKASFTGFYNMVTLSGDALSAPGQGQQSVYHRRIRPCRQSHHCGCEPVQRRHSGRRCGPCAEVT